MVKIRLLRAGAKKRPFYRVIAIDERRKRDGRALEFLGTYDPIAKPEAIRLRQERIDAWVAEGAQLSDAVRSLVKRARRQGAEAGASGVAAPPAAPAGTGGAGAGGGEAAGPAAG
jgi:small subunit ribosomal protein S16